MAVCPNGHDSASDDFCDICGMRIASAPGTSLSPGSTRIPAVDSSPAGTGETPGSHGVSGLSPTAGTLGTSVGQVPPSAATSEPCPRCGTAQSGQFCEACGYNFAAQPSWSAPPSSAPYPSPHSAPSAPVMPSARSAPFNPSLSSAPAVPTARPVRSAASAPATQTVPGSPYAAAVWTAVVSSDRDYYEHVRATSGPEWAEVPFPAYCAERRFPLTGNQIRIGRRSVSRGLDPEIDLTGPPADPGISRLHAVLIAAPDGSWAVLDPGSVNGTRVNGNEIPAANQVPLHDGDRINLGAWTAITVHRV
jgi:FHA domain